MHPHPADAKSLRDGRGAMPSIAHLAHPPDRNERLAPPVDTLGLCSLDARLLPLADELALRLGHHAQNGQVVVVR
jgi:hypothetical protein